MDAVLVIAILSTGALSSEIKQRTFSIDSRYNEKLATSRTVSIPQENLSSTQCAYICMNTELCEAFFYTPEKCYPYLNRMHDLVVTVFRPGMFYFEIKGRYNNLALGRPAIHSVPVPYFVAYRAVDGIRNPDFFPPVESCSHSWAGDMKPYLLVTLQQPYDVSTVALLARDVQGERNEGLTIQVDMQLSFASLSTCAVNPVGNPFVNEWRTFRCPQPIRGQYVKITKKGEYLVLCEVEIYA